MRVLVTGGTGSIGGAVVRVLLQRGHRVLATGRSAASLDALLAVGAEPLPGDIRKVGEWAHRAADVDAVIHAASTWADDIAETDTRVVDSLLGHLPRDGAFVYTGGCWMYGATGDVVATEESPLDSLPEFAWCLPTIERVRSAKNIRGMIVHPAMVYERDGGVFSPFVNDARTLGQVRVVGSTKVRWPLIHRDDLALLYALLVEQGHAGDVYNGATEPGVPVGRIARAIAARFGAAAEPVVRDVQSAAADFGDSAAGYALDQQMSGEKAKHELGWIPQRLDAVADHCTTRR